MTTRNKVKYYLKALSCLILITLFSGCATNRENTKVPQAFFANKSTIVITRMGGFEKACYRQIGSQGLLGCIVNEHMSADLANKIEKIDAKPILDEYYYRRYENSLRDKAFNVVGDRNPINGKDLQKIEDNDAKLPPYDFKPLKRKYNADYALVLISDGFGAYREYKSVFPTSEPIGFAYLRMYLINLSDNSIVGHYTSTIKQPVEDEWDTPPDYAAVIEASQSALTKALNKAYTFLFGILNPKSSSIDVAK